MQPRDFSDIWAFVRVVETGSFSGAARQMDTTKASISKQVARLEKTLHARLLNRSTRKLGLTEAGNAIFQNALRMLEEARALEATAAGLRAGPGGTLRVSASLAFGNTYLGGLLPDFMARYPDIRVVLSMTDRYVDLVEENIDVALRMAPRIDMLSAVARPIAPIRYVLAASPAYLDKNGTPASIAELAAHRCLTFGTSGAPLTWQFEREGVQQSVRVDSAMCANSSPALRLAMLRGGGIALLPTYVVGEDIGSGAALRVLPEWRPVGAFGDRLYAVYLENRFLPPKVRVFIDYLVEQIGERPGWDGFQPG
ncbi:LysR family transcriptional regulator [Massilia litorea]|uniref:LysR family transcriptional regulator n=1 Tax=Massilia litorea TaxID=2769491 RepID=A0A7L9U6L7_9BURK|nr:LysR family transcriptional regulator [Massilia litorea]QOL50069.1 LysR family transcriptional regulator [Massilia litorea]